MTNDETEERRAFKVHDRRRFSESGEPREAQPEPVDSRDEGAATTPPPSSGAATAPSPESAHDVEINFSTFVISLSTQALAHLGEIPNPIDNAVAADLAAARQIIDILGMLREKTKGNLDRSEQALLDNILYDLRMQYVESPHHQR
jgi:Domain of unknown function (DUF1844)